MSCTRLQLQSILNGDLNFGCGVCGLVKTVGDQVDQAVPAERQHYGGSDGLLGAINVDENDAWRGRAFFRSRWKDCVSNAR
jgi:hypothetical protein